MNTKMRFGKRSLAQWGGLILGCTIALAGGLSRRAAAEDKPSGQPFGVSTHVFSSAPAVAAQSLIERGEYLARAGDCIACHSSPSGEPFAGGLPLTTPFGTIISTNITPD